MVQYRIRWLLQGSIDADSQLSQVRQELSVKFKSQVKSSQVKSSQVKSSQVKSSQVKSSQVKSLCVCMLRSSQEWPEQQQSFWCWQQHPLAPLLQSSWQPRPYACRTRVHTRRLPLL